MGQNVEMKPADHAPVSALSQLKGVVTAIEKGVASKEMRLMARANRLILLVRRQLTASIVNLELNKKEIARGLDSRRLWRVRALALAPRDNVIHGHWLGRLEEVTDNVTMM